VHRANFAFTTSFPTPWRPPPFVKHHCGEVKPHSSAPIRDFPAFLLPFVLQEGSGAAMQGLPVTGFGWTIVRFTARSRLQSHAFNRRSAGMRLFLAMSSRSWRTRDWVSVRQKKVCLPRYLSPDPDFLHDTAWSPKTSTGPSHREHGLPAQSAGSKGTPSATSVT